MAPEQVKDFRQVDGRSDIYSLGVTLFRTLTGSVPFKGRTPVEVMIKVVEGKRPSIRSLEPEVPEDVELFVDRMMHRRPDNRFQDFAELIRDLEAILYRLRTEGEMPGGSQISIVLESAKEDEREPERANDFQEQDS
jgi:serine/threonine protein kinase